MPVLRADSSRSTLSVVIATVFVDIVGFGMILPILPGQADRFGSSPAAIGMLVASYSAIQFLLAPFWGRMSDRFGRRPVLLIGLAGSALSYVVFAIAGSFEVLLVSRLLDGGSGATVNVAQAYLADESPAEARARAMGKVGAAVGMGFIVGPLLGGIAASRGAATVGWVAAAITLANLIVAWRILPESARPRDIAAVPPLVVNPSRLALPLAVLFLATLAFSVMYVVFPLWSEQTLGASRSTVGYWFALVGLVTAVVQGGFLGRTVTWLGEHGSARLGTALLAVGLLSVPFAGLRGGLALYLVLAVLGAGYGLAGPAMLGLVSRLTGATRQGRILGVAQSATSLARIVGPVVAGMVMEAGGAGAAFGASAAVAGAGLATALVLGAATRDGEKAGKLEGWKA